MRSLNNNQERGNVMHAIKKTILLSLGCLLIAGSMPSNIYANAETKEFTQRLKSKGVLTLREGEKELNYEEYLLVLEKWNNRQAVADSLIVLEEQAIADLRDEITNTEMLSAQTLQETYDMLGITQDDVDALDVAIGTLRDRVYQLDTYSDAELQDAEKAAELDSCTMQLDTLKSRPAAMLFVQEAALNEVGDLIAAIQSRKDNYIPPKPPEPETYTVTRGDWLSKLAEYDDVYGKGNFHMWPQIFRANRDLIVGAYKRANNANYNKPEDLIFPAQELAIPR